MELPQHPSKNNLSKIIPIRLIYCWSFWFLCLYTSTLFSQSTPQHYFHLPANSGVNNLFFNDAACEKFQFIYTQPEIANMVNSVSGPISIDTIWFRFGGGTSNPSTVLTNFQIRMGHTTLINPGNQFNTNFNVGAAQTVLSSASYTLTPLIGTWNVPSNNWTFIVLQTPFSYNFTNNLCVELSFSSSSAAIAGNYADNGGVPISQYAGISTATTATSTSSRPMFGISSGQACPSVTATSTQTNVTCNGGNDGSATVIASGGTSFTYSWSPTGGSSATATGLSTGNYTCTITNQCGNSTTQNFAISVTPCGNFCDPTGNLIIYSNYDGGILTINVDQNIPNLKVGICSYEPIQVNFTGPFVGNITQVIYAGMNSNQNNNNCGLGNFTTSITGVPAGIVAISPPMNPPQVGYTPAHGNGSGPWGGQMLGVAGLCDTMINAGGGNTPDEVVYYFLNATSGTLLYHQTQYACWVNEILNVSVGGNCCILPPNNNPCPTVTATSSQINVTCNGGSDGSAIVIASGGTSFTYSWSPTGGSSATATGLSAGNYTCTITNQCGNSTTQNFAITVTNAYQLNATVTQPTCGNNNGCISFSPTPTGTYFYTWPFPTNMIVNSVCDLAPGSYDITINSVNGCPIDTTIVLTNSNSLTINANPEMSIINPGDAVQLNVSGGISYTWTPSASLSCSVCSDPIATPTTNTIYVVIGTDANGCSGTDTVYVNLLPVTNFEFPNVITTNGDGINDLFEIENLQENTEVIILNRWGNVVFSAKNYQNNWDGRDTSGNELTDGVYFYKYTTESGNTGHGFVMLIR